MQPYAEYIMKKTLRALYSSFVAQDLIVATRVFLLKSGSVPLSSRLTCQSHTSQVMAQSKVTLAEFDMRRTTNHRR